jgi:hypothetical protein
MQKIKEVMMDGKEMKNNYLVLYSDKSIATRTKNKDEYQTGSFMEGVGELIKYNTDNVSSISDIYSVINKNELCIAR